MANESISPAASKRMNRYLLTSITAFLLSVSSIASAKSEPSPFDFGQLAGTWVDNFNNEVACQSTQPHFRFEVDAAAKRITFIFDRKSGTALGAETDRYAAAIVKATSNTLVIRYDDEKRLTPDGKPVEWELIVVAPGVYRWRATDWVAGRVNVVVGIRCTLP